MPKYLQKRRRRWYAVMEIPADLRRRFGRPRFIKSLETESLTLAERRVLPIIVEWRRLIDLARSGNTSLEAEASVYRDKYNELMSQGVPQWEIEEAFDDVAINLAHDTDLALEASAIAVNKWTLLSENIDSYIASLAGIEKPKSIDQKHSDLRRFCTKFKYAHDVTRKLVIGWVENELMGQGRLSAATCSRMISAARGYWDYLERHKDLELPSPFQKVVPSKKKARTMGAALKSKRKSFSTEDFRLLKNAVPQNDQMLGDLMELAAYSGCRIEELCSLKLEKVSIDRFEIEDAKTAAGCRTIPIHPKLSELVIRLQSESADEYLLGGLTFNKYGDRSNAIGKRFGRLKKKCGYGEDMVFHSFRKGVASQLENSGVPENITARLLGHEFYTMSYGVYSGGVSFEVLKEAIGKLDWGL